VLRIFIKAYLKDKGDKRGCRSGKLEGGDWFSPVTTPTVPESGSPRTPRKIDIHRLHRSAYIPISQTFPHGSVQSSLTPRVSLAPSSWSAPFDPPCPDPSSKPDILSIYSPILVSIYSINIYMFNVPNHFPNSVNMQETFSYVQRRRTVLHQRYINTAHQVLKIIQRPVPWGHFYSVQ